MAPISPEWTWRQTETTVTVDVKAKGVAKRSCDIFLSDYFLKINAPPYLLALDLFGEINEERSTATISNGLIRLHLFKVAKGSWDTFALPIKENREAIMKRRRESIERAQKKVEERRKERIALREKEERDAVDRSIELDKRKRQAIEDAKKKELESAREEITSFSSSKAPGASSQPPLALNKGIDKDGTNVDSDSDSDRDTESERGEEESSEDDVVEGEDEEEEEEEEEEIVILPPPREIMPSVSVEFTPTIVENLPAREGREEELKLIKRSQNRSGNDADIDIEERHPIFLKDKGDKMLKSGNVKGALHAYSRALEIDPEHLLCTCNRSLCYLKLGEASKAETDCRRAIEKLANDSEGKSSDVPAEVEDFKKKKLLRIKMSGRLAKALAAQGKTKQVIEELQAALKLSSGDPELHALIQQDLDDALACDSISIDEALENMSTAAGIAQVKGKIQSMKGIADSRIKQGDPDGAVKVYSQITDIVKRIEAGVGGLSSTNGGEMEILDREFLIETKLACFSNSASGKIMKGRFLEAVRDCNAAILVIAELFSLYYGALEQGEIVDHEVGSILSLVEVLINQSTQPAQHMEFENKRSKKVASMVRILRRMSCAFGHLKEYEKGVTILKTCLKICDESKVKQEIQNDMNVLSRHV